MLIQLRKRKYLGSGEYEDWSDWGSAHEAVTIVDWSGDRHVYRFTDDGSQIHYQIFADYTIGDESVSSEYIGPDAEHVFISATSDDEYVYQFRAAEDPREKAVAAAPEEPPADPLQQAWMQGYEYGLRHAQELASALYGLVLRKAR